MLALCSPGVMAAYYNISHDIAFGATANIATYQCMKIKINVSQSVTLINVTRATGSTGAMFVLKNAAKTDIYNVTWASAESKNMGYTLVNGTTYFLCNYDSGATFTLKYNDTRAYVINRTFASWLGAMDGVTEDTSYVRSIEYFTISYDNSTPPEIPLYNYTLTSTPKDINSTTTGLVTINLAVTPTTTILANSTANLSYKIFTSLNNGCAVFYQELCNRSNAYLNSAMPKMNNSRFNITFDDNDYLPGYYPFNYKYMGNEPTRYNYSAYNNHYVRFIIYNMSTNASAYFIGLEFSANNKTGASGVLNIFYCNSSYTAGNPATSANCVIVDSFVPNELAKHAHKIASHYFIPVVINNITKTQTGSFVFISNAPNIGNAWNFEYMLNTTYNNRSFQIDNYADWTNTSNLFDIHFHSYNPTQDYFAYYAFFSDGNTSNNQSPIVYDFYNLTQFPPSIPFVYTPVCNAEYTIGSSANTNIFYNWSEASDINPADRLTLDFCLYDPGLVSCVYALEVNGTGRITNNTHNISLNLTTGYSGVFYNYFTVCDEFGNCDLGYDINCPISLCQNSWSKSIQPCEGGVSRINYTDVNNCPEAYDLPPESGGYENCTSVTNVEFSFSNTSWLFIVMILMMFMFLALAFKISYIFLAFDGLILGLFAFVYKTALGDMSNVTFIVMLCVAGLFIIAGFLAMAAGRSRG